jgi:hypothetical protein
MLLHYGIRLDHPTLIVAGGTLDLGDADHLIQDVTHSGGMITGSCNATITGRYAWSGS